jgi:multimeric flavodoxin WrbA
MKVVTINSSPRNAAQSKTSLLLKHLIKGMRSAEAEVTDFDIHDTHIDYCTACFA